MSALLIGLIAGVVCYFMVAVVKARLGYDDSLDAFGVHGVGGTIGALLTGVFASQLINPVFKDAQGHALPLGMIDGNFRQLGNQAVGVLIAIALAAVGTYVILQIVDLVLGCACQPRKKCRASTSRSMAKKVIPGKFRCRRAGNECSLQPDKVNP